MKEQQFKQQPMNPVMAELMLTSKNMAVKRNSKEDSNSGDERKRSGSIEEDALSPKAKQILALQKRRTVVISNPKEQIFSQQ
jgi:hypothetical protein